MISKQQFNRLLQAAVQKIPNYNSTKAARLTIQQTPKISTKKSPRSPLTHNVFSPTDRHIQTHICYNLKSFSVSFLSILTQISLHLSFFQTLLPIGRVSLRI
jgi:hypothetical protein